MEKKQVYAIIKDCTPKQGVALEGNRFVETNDVFRSEKTGATMENDNVAFMTSRVVSFDGEDDEMSAKVKFDAVAVNRISEDEVGLSELGVQAWTLDDFELVRKIGEGGASLVYEAKEKQSGYSVALKAQDADELIAESEIDIHLNLNHPGVVKLIDYFYSDSFFGQIPPCDDEEPKRFVYMILELCEGGSLCDIIRSADGRLCESKAAYYMKSAMQALNYIHSEEIIHCDVKTSNFVISKAGQLKLADFGFSVRDDERGLLCGGTLMYMSPEQLLAWRDQTDDYDDRVDIYSLGIVMYELLVGDVPYAVVGDCHNDYPELESEDLAASCNSNFPPQIIDLRELDKETIEEALPRPRLPDFVSEDAQDLISSLLTANPAERISLSKAILHPWIQESA